MTGPEKQDLPEGQKIDTVKKQEDISKKYPDLDAKEKGVLAGLDIKFDPEKGMSPETINQGMNARFDEEVAKAGISGDTPELKKQKEQLSEKIKGTPDMKEKIALYQEFLNGLSSEVGTQVAEQNQRSQQNSDAMKKEASDNDKKKETTNQEKPQDTKKKFSLFSAHVFGEFVREAQLQEVMRAGKEQQGTINTAQIIGNGVSALDQGKASTDLDIAMKDLGWPGEAPKTMNA